EVYKAEDMKLGRPVAIKLVSGEDAADDKSKRRLLQEARSASALSHPNIVTIHSIDNQDGLDFIVMEYVEGETLKARIERGALALPELLDLGIQLAEALAAAHSLGVIHRDIKSANVLITSRGQAKVLDFGLAKMLRPLPELIDKEAPTITDLTGAGIVMGTVAYMSPEQTRGETLDARSDVFSLGCVLYEAATGKVPFSGPSVLAILHEIAAGQVTPPTRIRRDLPRQLDLIIDRALAKKKEERYSSAAELADGLRTLRAATSAGFPGLSMVMPEVETGPESESFVGREPEMKKLVDLLR